MNATRRALTAGCVSNRVSFTSIAYAAADNDSNSQPANATRILNGNTDMARLTQKVWVPDRLLGPRLYAAPRQRCDDEPRRASRAVRAAPCEPRRASRAVRAAPRRRRRRCTGQVV